MSNFTEIKTVYTPEKKLSAIEMLRAIKLAITSEFEAIQIYQQIMESTTDKRIIGVLKEITEDEKHHVGGLYKLLELLSPTDHEEYEYGYRETEENYK